MIFYVRGHNNRTERGPARAAKTEASQPTSIQDAGDSPASWIGNGRGSLGSDGNHLYIAVPSLIGEFVSAPDERLLVPESRPRVWFLEQGVRRQKLMVYPGHCNRIA